MNNPVDYNNDITLYNSVMFRRLDCLRRTQRFYSLNSSNTVLGRESFVDRHIGPNDVEQQQMLKELGYQVLILLLTI